MNKFLSETHRLSGQVVNSKGSQGGWVQKPAFEKAEKVRLYQIAQNGGCSLAGHQPRQGLFHLDFHSLVGQLSQEPNQGHLLRTSLGGQMHRKMCSGLTEPTQCAEEREDRQVGAIRPPQALQALTPHVALRGAPNLHRPRHPACLRQRTERSTRRKEGGVKPNQ